MILKAPISGLRRNGARIRVAQIRLRPRLQLSRARGDKLIPIDRAGLGTPYVTEAQQLYLPDGFRACASVRSAQRDLADRGIFQPGDVALPYLEIRTEDTRLRWEGEAGSSAEGGEQRLEEEPVAGGEIDAGQIGL